MVDTFEDPSRLLKGRALHGGRVGNVRPQGHKILALCQAKKAWLLSASTSAALNPPHLASYSRSI